METGIESATETSCVFNVHQKMDSVRQLSESSHSAHLNGMHPKAVLTVQELY
jgi:hypothetical protein